VAREPYIIVDEIRLRIESSECTIPFKCFCFCSTFHSRNRVLYDKYKSYLNTR